MAKYKLLKKVADSKSFRWGGQKYEGASAKDNQKLLKSLFNGGCWFVSEIKESKKPTKKTINNDTEKENDNAND